MATITLDNLDLAVGLSWSALLGTSSESIEIKNICAENRSIFGAVVRADDVTVVGVSRDGASKLPCAAAWLARAADPGEILVLVEPVDSRRSWLCAIRQCAPIPEYDVIVENDDLDYRIQALREDTQGFPFRLYSRAGFVSGSEPSTFSDFVEGTKRVQITQISGTNKRLIMGAALVALVVVGALFGQNYMVGKNRVESLRRIAANNASIAAAERDAIEKWKQDITSSAERVVTSGILHKPAIGPTVHGWFSAVENLPASLMGWTLERIKCTGAECEATWTRAVGSTIDAFAEAADVQGWEVRSVLNNTAITAHPSDAFAREGQVSMLPNEKEFRNHFTSQFQRMEIAGVTFSITAAETVKVDVPPPSTAGGQKTAAVAPDIPWKIGTFSVGGRNLYEPKDMHEYIDFANSALETLVIDRKAGLWSADGKYAVKGL